MPAATATAAELIRSSADKLAGAGVESARLDAEVLLRHLLGIDRTALFMRLREPIDSAIAIQMDSLIERRLAGTPVAYLTGVREFMGLPFAVGPGVLVPRPETEMLVECAAERVGAGLTVDVGTGSGAIILALAATTAARSGMLVGSDRSREALDYARRNRAALGLADRVHLVRGDLLGWLGRPADLILANLPYLRPEQVAQNPEIHAEPKAALISGDDGLDAIARLLADAPRILAPQGALILELDPIQANDVASLGRQRFPGSTVDILHDLAGFARFVTIERH